MAARDITPADVETALRAENVELPAGRIESRTRDFTLRVARGYTTPADFAAVPLRKGADGYVVRLGAVAPLELASAARRAYYQRNAQPQIGLGSTAEGRVWHTCACSVRCWRCTAHQNKK